MRLTKHHGLGNDFLVALESVNGPLHVGPATARLLCDRHRGIGADGLVMGRSSTEAVVAMELLNADGSRAEISGNGLRCLVHAVARANGWGEGEMLVQTDAGPRHAVFRPGDRSDTLVVDCEMGVATVEEVEVPAQAGASRAWRVDVGNPHLVLLVDDLSDISPSEEGAALQRLLAGGVNVEWVVPAKDGVDLVVYERGVGPTLACGSGAVAAVAALWRGGAFSPKRSTGPISVRMPGGRARVSVDADSGMLTLSGPSVFVGTVEIEDEFLAVASS
ncbi:MAG: diaminopimelate epimerase [Acidimicrobiales bacterium]|nr:MAG: diaminopimelate epimerase [Acidimicrobiales bacterium]